MQYALWFCQWDIFGALLAAHYEPARWNHGSCGSDKQEKQGVRTQARVNVFLAQTQQRADYFLPERSLHSLWPQLSPIPQWKIWKINLYQGSRPNRSQGQLSRSETFCFYISFPPSGAFRRAEKAKDVGVSSEFCHGGEGREGRQGFLGCSRNQKKYDLKKRVKKQEVFSL